MARLVSYFWRFYSAALATLRYFGYLGCHAFSLVSFILPPFIGYRSSESEKPNDLEANRLVGLESTSNCDTYTIRLHPQYDLKTMGIGASAHVYEVDDQIVLKTSWIFEPPGSSAPDNDRWHYASDTLFQSNLLQNERTVLRLLQQRPHPHIIEAIDVDHNLKEFISADITCCLRRKFPLNFIEFAGTVILPTHFVISTA